MSDNQHINRYLFIMNQINSLAKFRNPFGNQEIELQEVVYEGGGTPMLRLRIRERGARFTVFDIDPVTTKFWADEMLKWATPLAGPDSGKDET
jgi:type II secretory pathway component HofQ